MSGDKMKNFSEALQSEIENVDSFLFPLLKEYLNKVRDIRMAMGLEIKNIIQSSRQLNELARNTKEIGELAENIQKLKDILTPEMVELLRRITNDKS